MDSNAIKLSKIKSVVLFVAMLVLVSNTNASVLDNTIQVNFVNVTLLEALTKIEQQANITFSFKSSDISQNKKVSLQASNITIEQALNKLLANQQVGYRALGTQIILYKKSQPNDPKYITNKSKNTNPITDTVRYTVVDSIQVFDTIRISINDTVLHMVYDTVRTTIEQVQKPKLDNSNFTVEMQYSISKGRNDEFQNTNYSTITETVSYINTVSCLLGIKKKRFELQTGIGYGAEAKEFEYSKQTLSSSIIKIPSIVDYIAYDSMYYVIKPLDTVWTVTPVVRKKTVYTDSISTDTSYQKQKIKLSVGKIDVPIFLRMNVVEKQRWNAFIGTGLIFSFIQLKKTAFVDADNKPIVQLQNITTTPILSTLYGSVGINYELFNQLFVTFSSFVSYQISDAYLSENMQETNPLRFGLKLGLKKNIQ